MALLTGEGGAWSGFGRGALEGYLGFFNNRWMRAVSSPLLGLLNDYLADTFEIDEGSDGYRFGMLAAEGGVQVSAVLAGEAVVARGAAYFLSGTTYVARGAGMLPRALQGGEATTHVYFGVRNGQRVYVGITNNLKRRQSAHGSRFVLEQITRVPVTRGEARAIEQALIVRYPSFENINNCIDPRHSYYQQAVVWGEAWLRRSGI